MPLKAEYFHSHDFAKLSSREIYQWLVASIVPRPIAFITTQDEYGATNLAPFSFFNGVSSNPPCLVFSVARKPDGSKKDTLLNIEKNGEFVVNSSQEDITREVNAASENFPYGISEFEKIGLTPLPSLWVKPPRVRESAIQMECRLEKLVPIGEEGAGSATLVIGRVLGIHISDHVIEGNTISYEKLKPLARLGGKEWLRGGEVFSLDRP